jgi:hypothetical protein
VFESSSHPSWMYSSGVYTRVSNYAGWINDMICQETSSLSLQCIFASVFIYLNTGKHDPKPATPVSIPHISFPSAPVTSSPRGNQPTEAAPTLTPTLVPTPMPTEIKEVMGMVAMDKGHSNRKVRLDETSGVKSDKLVRRFRGSGR